MTKRDPADPFSPPDNFGPHIPVMGREAVAWLQPRAGGIYLDATFGAGGYTRLLLQTPDVRVIGLDRDRTAIAAGAALVEEADGRLELIEARFSELDAVCASLSLTAIDGVVMDIGVSSMQLDRAERGFSFRFEGPLDMRMGAEGPCAADVVAQANEADLARIIYILGEERHSRAIARAIVAMRRETPILTTKALADVVTRVVRHKPGDIHPATRTFQALRIFVNDELNELARALSAAEMVLKPGARLVVVSFHSLEDRIVKTFFAERGRVQGGSRHAPEIVRAAPSFAILTRRPEVASDQEIAANPRARSAKLRVAERSQAAAHEIMTSLLPDLPPLGSFRMGGH